jgi:putative endonuclease
MKFHNYYIYIVTNPTKTTLYIGVTNDLDKRMAEHEKDAFGKKSTFSGKYACFNLIYYEYFFDI